MPEDRSPLGAPEDVPRVRQDRMLRQLAQPARNRALPRIRASADPLRAAGGGLELVLRGRADVPAGAGVIRPYGYRCPELRLRTQGARAAPSARGGGSPPGPTRRSAPRRARPR